MANLRKIELLSPAGDSERLHTAVLYGADAVYAGTAQFSMRSRPPNFDRDTLLKDVEFAHENGVKVYLTCNTLPRNSEISGFEEYIHYADSIGIDALIISDIGLFMIAKRILPDMEIHMSTQTGIVNYETATTLYNMGAKRVVLARELSLCEIAEIRAKTPSDLDLECFVHGSMCVSFSGRCLLSQYMTNRDANRGVCAQPCRFKYSLIEETRQGQHFEIEEDDSGSYILNAEDLNMIEHIDELAKAGVSSFKIEGRAKSAYYVSVVTNAYKKAINLYEMSNYFRNSAFISELIDELNKVSHRPYGTGFFFGEPREHYETGGYIRSYDVAAVVTDCKNGKIFCEQRNKLLPDTDAEIVIPFSKNVNTDSIFTTVHIGKLHDMTGVLIPDTKHPKMEFSFDYTGSYIPAGSLIRIEGLKAHDKHILQ
jgi:putative protease